MAASVEPRASVTPRSMFLTVISLIPAALANSACFQPTKARAARICRPLITGRDEHGHFCKPGDPTEIVARFGMFIATRKDMAETVHILGTARGCYVELPQGRNLDRRFFRWMAK